MGKNWNAIAATKNPHLRLALTQIAEDEEDGLALKRAFPFCFVEHASLGKVPLSAIVRKGWEKDEGTGFPDMEHACVALDIPYVLFALREELYDADRENMLGLMSKEWQADNAHEFGDEVAIGGSRYVVLDNVENDELLLAPVERVHADTRDQVMRPTTA